MQIHLSLESLRHEPRPIHWAMGFFDGVHTGHRRVMHSATTPGALRGVLTFARHPLALLCPEKQPLLLTPDAEYKAELIAREGGADLLLRLPFTPELAALSPESFLDALAGVSRIAGISVGANWRFGSGGSGTPELLQREGRKRGFRVCVNPLSSAGGECVSSSRIRAALAAGALSEVAAMLGRRFCAVGQVQHGQHLARRLGFPTANLRLPAQAALPPFGVYRVLCHTGSGSYPGLANLGLRPTIHEATKVPGLETHLPGHELDLYGQRIAVEFIDFMRPERAFASLEELQAQVQRDLAAFASAQQAWHPAP